MAFGGVVQQYTYGDINNLTGESTTIDGQTRSLGYEHNSLGHVSAITYPNNHWVEFIPNALGQATLVRNSTTAKTYASNILYHPSGAVNSYTYGNNLRYSLTQNQQKLPENISVNNAANTSVLVGFTYGYDNNLNISSITEIINNQATAYNIALTYDGLNRLKTANGNWGNGTFNYDSLGNIQNYTLGSFNLNYSYNANKQLTSTTGGKSYSFNYDERGNVTKNTAAGNAFNYNLANQMTGIGSNTYTYDGHNRRVKKQTPLGSEYFIYTKAGTLLHNQKANGTNQNYIYLGNSLIAKVDTTANVINYVHTDHLGSVVAESNSSGQISKRFHYKPFGETIETQQDDIGYTGHKHDADLGLTYMQARYYDPVLGRFYGNDPIGFTGKVDTFNRYSYVANNPYRYTDPKGMAKCGSNLKGQKCEEALNDADQARNDATTVSNGIKDITAKMAAGEKLSDADNATVAAIGEKFGDKFTSEKGLNKLAGGLDKAANKIGARGEGVILSAGNNRSIPFSGGRVPPAYVWSPLASKINLNDKYFGYGSTNRQSIMLHESAHLAGAWRDNYIQDGSNPLFNKSSGYSNADTYSCLVYPGSCGF